MWLAIYSDICHELFYIGSRGFWIEAHFLKNLLRQEHELLVFRGSLLSSGLHGLRKHILEPIDKSECEIKGWDLRSTWHVAELHHLDLEWSLHWVHLLSLDSIIMIILVILPWGLAIDFIIFIIIIWRGLSYIEIKQVDKPTFWVLWRIIVDFLAVIYLIHLLFFLDRLVVLDRGVLRRGDGIKWSIFLDLAAIHLVDIHACHCSLLWLLGKLRYLYGLRIILPSRILRLLSTLGGYLLMD